MNVKARSSVFRYKGKDANTQTIGKELNVQAILTGRVVALLEQPHSLSYTGTAEIQAKIGHSA